YGADIFLSPVGYMSLRTKVPPLAVIHDINFVHRPADLPWLKAEYYNFFFPRFAEKAKRIATVSSYSKEDIVDSFNIDRGKIDVVFDGVNQNFTPLSDDERKGVRDQIASGSNYFLFVGALNPRKNVCGLLKAFDVYKSRSGDDVKLVIVGGQMHKTGPIFRVYENMKFKSDVIFTGRVSVANLRQIYGAALALAFVPFFEGFGIPVIEAMSAGVPVICSNVTSLPEVGGDAVLYTDPSDIDEIADAMIKISEDVDLRRLLIERGFNQSHKFSWENTAALLWECIEKSVIQKDEG
ncbi:MAG: glycosyltransferase family 1 protein, partial [Prolixibacteraceae bacterium]|nr:glycosyltransferase family 1 protein [Prolixibacteraceae bacterium]